MSKGRLAVVGFAIVVGCMTLGAADDVRVTGGWMNGRMWNEISSMEKSLYVTGVRDASAYMGAIVAAITNKSQNELGVLAQNLTVGEICRELDAFYTEPTNTPIPVISALRYVKNKAEGASEAELKELNASLRSLAQK